MKSYDHKKIEKKWQKDWRQKKVYETADRSKKPKFYVLDMFPYPSGEGLHVGHPKGYIATDVLSRMKRMQGFNVLHPMGFDAFGLPAENYAIKMKVNPAVAVAKNVARFKKQLEIIGFDYDWSREVNTTDPKFYKWTQWAFLKLLEKGLAYESFEPINWCPSCKTGLANEDVEDGKCERCGTPVEKKPMRQWVIRITDYADRLLADLDAVDPKTVPNTTVEFANGIPCFTQVTEESAVRPDLPFVERNAIVAIVKHWSEDKYLGLKWKKVDWQTLLTGGVEDGQSSEEAAAREIVEETGYLHPKFVKKLGKLDSKFFHVPKGVNRYGHFDVMHFALEDGKRQAISKEEKGNHELLWLTKDEMTDFLSSTMSQRYAWSTLMWGKKWETPAPKPLLDWPESIKEAQRNWIGRSEGAEIDFVIKGRAEKLTVFTTRPDTLFGVTYVVVAPEHGFVTALLKHKENLKNHDEVVKYVAHARVMTEIERTDAKKDKTGVRLDGVFAINPANREEVPVYVADYVLADYGTGAVMAVPAHDDRDLAFAKKYDLPIRQVIVPEFGTPRPDEERRDGGCAIVFDPKSQRYAVNLMEDGRIGFFSGGVDKGETMREGILREVREEGGLYNFAYDEHVGKVLTHYYNMQKKVNRLAGASCFLVILKDTKVQETKHEAHEKFSLHWATADEIVANLNKYNTDHGRDHWLWFFNQAVGRAIELGHDTTSDKNAFKAAAYTGAGLLADSGEFDGQASEKVQKRITEFARGKWVVRYRLKDWVFSRQRYWGEPFPILHDGSLVVPVPEKDLPVVLPKVKSYEPTGTGESPLADISKWVNVKVGKGKDAKRLKRETNTMPQWAGSSWYYLRYMDPKNSKALVDPKKERYWNTVDFYVGGAEHATRHLIYARFWHKFLYDIGAVSTIEPFKKLQSVGLIMGEDGQKMSKRFGNVVNPDDIVATYGADTMRIYEMFMGPFDQAIAWSTKGMVGSRRFIERVWRLRDKVKSGSALPPAADILLNKTIVKVSEDIAVLHHNTAISALMILSNELEACESLPREAYESLLKLLAPFAPHMAEELWASLGNKKSVHASKWPVADRAKIASESATIAVQVNGKTRATFQSSKTATNAELEKAALSLDEVKKWLGGKSPAKVIVVPGRLVSIVAKV